MVNHFSIMLQRRLREQTQGDEEEEESEKSAKKKKKGGGRGGDLRIHDLEDDFEMSSDDSDNSLGEGCGGAALGGNTSPRWRATCVMNIKHCCF